MSADGPRRRAGWGGRGFVINDWTLDSFAVAFAGNVRIVSTGIARE